MTFSTLAVPLRTSILGVHLVSHAPLYMTSITTAKVTGDEYVTSTENKTWLQVVITNQPQDHERE